MRRFTTMLGLGLVAAGTIAGSSTSALPPARTTVPGYTESQAEEGSQLYAQRCAMCHGLRLEGTYETPGLTGKFIANWGNRPLSDLFDYLGHAMPQFAPGTLTPEEDARIVAFIMKQNGVPAGPGPLPADSTALRGMRIGPIAPR
jgi:mono/diheme cytochrome c family protein